MLGFSTAKRALELGRGAFFQDDKADIPQGRSASLQADDLIPQFGFVGANYPKSRIFLIGINPGNGRRNDARTQGDSRMMPALECFATNPTEENFAIAMSAYQDQCQSWPLWRRHCADIIGAGKLSLDDIAYSNCLPWRTESQSNFEIKVAVNALRLYVLPLLSELEPKLIVALGKRAHSILGLAQIPLPPMIVWNRAQAATLSVRQDRAQAASQILELTSSRS